ncbi:AAA family ATPase [Kitasatospora sp. MAP5-34]|uniref:AAA family ATPase n=1 Tax=Kitasatospora sp. MAP5-34 TaxID=3035102 RepID=UPI00247478BB|nr:AAA family ATPase [Kitasatospora sp. MAP5-34]MDH6578856.1 ABC-type Mn2+/Zn2+ transport system ATPase subunit [Kitasatospora sp. MAP5-34]
MSRESEPIPAPSPALDLTAEVTTRLKASVLSAAARELVTSALGATRTHTGAVTGGVYLESITVKGFRGIGPATTIQLKPGPGLTVVAGRNGTGKSSFAEGIEVALTGQNARWPNEGAEAQKRGWRNLHHPESPRLDLGLRISGHPSTVTLTRTWPGASFNLSHAEVTGFGPTPTPVPFASLGWDAALCSYRPILSYSELGQMVTSRPSQLHDALASILGLGALTEALSLLHAREKELTTASKQANAALPDLRSALADVDDPRTQAATAALAGRTPDLDTLHALVAGSPTTKAEELAQLHRLTELTAPDMDAVAETVSRLRTAAAAAEDARFSTAGDAHRLADLLDRAVDHRRRHPESEACPVCGSEDRLDTAWAAQAVEQIVRLRDQAHEAETAHRELNLATGNLLALIDSPPAFLPAHLLPVWRDWTQCRDIPLATELAAMAEKSAAILAEACRQVREDAVRRLAQQDQRWQGVVARLAVWIALADEAAAAEPLLTQVKAARTWLKGAHAAIRDERMLGIVETSQQIWAYLRQESSITLGSVQLTGSANRRSVTLDVTVDDMEAPALTVVSQGEMFALALSLFLPRATTPQSPFQFIVIDDPVQSMDPRKVEGLARALHAVAATRQVIVFTHDTRLQDALRFLSLKATVLNVARQPGSVIEVTVADDPVKRELTAARAISNDRHVTPEILAEVLPGLCRAALEAALHESAWRNLLDGGIEHHVAEEKIRTAGPLVNLASLALFRKRESPGRVYTEITARLGKDTSDLISLCNEGSHSTADITDPKSLIDRTAAVAKELRCL